MSSLYAELNACFYNDFKLLVATYCVLLIQMAMRPKLHRKLEKIMLISRLNQGVYQRTHLVHQKTTSTHTVSSVQADLKYS